MSALREWIAIALVAVLRVVQFALMVFVCWAMWKMVTQ